MENEITELSAALGLLEDVLGSSFIKQEVHKIGGWNPEAAPGLHPLVLLWYKTREDLGLAELTGCLPHSRWVQETLQIAELLQGIAGQLDYPGLVEGLKDHESWLPTLDRIRELGCRSN